MEMNAVTAGEKRGCPGLEEIVAFALNPLNEEHAELAGHFFSCGECLAALRLANACILSDREAQNSGKKGDAETGILANVSERLALWKRLEDKIAAMVALSQHAMGALSAAEAAEFSRVPPAAFLWGGAVASPFAVAPAQGAENPEAPFTDESIDILFVAECSRDDSAYWEAELTIPPGANIGTALIVSVTDGRGNTIPSGAFFLGDLKAEVCEGLAEIALKDFQASLKTAFVALQVPGEAKINGQLCLRC